MGYSANKVFHKKDSERFVMLFAGDTSFGENYQEKIKEKGGESVLEKYGYDYGLEKFKTIMNKSDLVILNLETPVTDCQESPFEGSKSYIHWTDIQKSPKCLKKHNVSLVSLANNHSYDYGKEGFEQTLEILAKNEIPVIGAGENIDAASQPYICEVNFENKKFKFAIIAAFEESESSRTKYGLYAEKKQSGVMPLNTKKIAAEAAKIKKLDPDIFIILFPHWGGNYKWINNRQRKIAEELLNGDVDMIIGHGAHMIQEFEKINNKLVLYSIGNFMFHSPGRYQKMKAPPYSAIVNFVVKMDNGKLGVNLEVYPIITDNKITNYQPRFLLKDEVSEFEKTLNDQKIVQKSSLMRKLQLNENGYFFKLEPSLATHKYIGMLYHKKYFNRLRKGEDNLIMYRAFAIDHELQKHGFKLIIYAPEHLDKDSKTISGFVIENNRFITVHTKIPKVNYDFHIGSDRLSLYKNLEPWINKNGFKIYPTKKMRKFASDKLYAGEIITKSDNKTNPYTEVYQNSSDQIARFLELFPVAFIKPRYGAMGDGVIVVRSIDQEFIVENYFKKVKYINSFKKIKEALKHISDIVADNNYIIQQAVDVLLYNGRVFDIRVIIFNEGENWHFMGEMRIGLGENSISNGGETADPFEFLERIYPKEKAASILDKIKDTTLGLAKSFSSEFNEHANEMAFDILIDKNDNIFIAEINTKPGLAGVVRYESFFNMSENEKYYYKTLALKHGELIAKSLISRL